MSVGIKINHAVKAYGDNVVIPDLHWKYRMGNSLPYWDHPAAARPHC